MSDWSLWSPCSKTCRAVDLSPGYRTRTRKLKQIPIGGGKECPPPEEKEACNIVGDLLPECPRYTSLNVSSHNMELILLLKKMTECNVIFTKNEKMLKNSQFSELSFP